MEYNYIEIGNRIRTKRKELEYNQDTFIDMLSREMGIDLDTQKRVIGRNTLSDLENGNLPPNAINLSMLIAMCKLFNCDIGYLLGEYNENTRNEKIIKEELHLSTKAITNIKTNKSNSIKRLPVPTIQSTLEGKKEYEECPDNETFIHSLNLILEEYPELIARIGRIMLHDELHLYTEYLQRGSSRMNKSYDIDKPLLNFVIQLKYFVENNKKLPTKYIDNAKRYEYAIQFITKHMKKLEEENQTLHHCLISTTDYTDDDIYK